MNDTLRKATNEINDSIAGYYDLGLYETLIFKQQPYMKIAFPNLVKFIKEIIIENA